MDQDWGDSEGGGKLATLKEFHSHKRDERKFQVQVLLIFAVFAGVAEIFQAINAAIVAKDVILTTLPVFTFVLGKLETKNG